ncbi:MAG: cupin domain-containing protein [Chitinophagaceae bacterium]|nr:MAG: cupin domain-containing protein [Chitinophagaceae bacterium]
MKKANIGALVTASLFFASCGQQAAPNGGAAEPQAIFPKGTRGPAENFTGSAWNTGLVDNDSVYNTVVGNVYFEPGARSNWHRHPAGQILVITGGVGYHQLQGGPLQTIRKGDVVKCPPNVLHWHGASRDTGLQQLYIIPHTEKGIVEWKEPVTDDVYRQKIK